MAHVLVTGSTAGLGRAAAEELIASGHDVVLHARNAERANDLDQIVVRAAGLVVADLADPDHVHRMADDLARRPRFDAVIHNAGIYAPRSPELNSLGQPSVIAVNLYAPYVLTARMGRTGRLVYLSSDMHAGVRPDLSDLNWSTRRWNGTMAYSESKLLVTALALAVSRRWADVRSDAVDPGWVPTRMGGSGATDDLSLGHRTQTWLATAPVSEIGPSGGYWYHRRRHDPAAIATDVEFQEDLLGRLAEHTEVRLHR